jgi:hypothetical protein
MVAAMALAACAGMGQRLSGSVTTACDDGIDSGAAGVNSPSAPQAMRTMVNGEPIDVVLGSSGKLEAALDAMDGQGNILKAKIASIRSSAFADGLSGGSALLFLNAADHTLNTNGGYGEGVTAETTGEIQAYNYDNGDGSGCLRVLMVTTATRANGVQTSLAFIWTVAVRAGGFTAAQKLETSNPNYSDADVFHTGPGTPADTVAISKDMAAGFEYKLWAKGDSIDVVKVERRVGNGNFVEMPSSSPLYGTTAESCIDMMFAAYPPATLPAGSGPPFYCLGRCKNPYIVNTK